MAKLVDVDKLLRERLKTLGSKGGKASADGLTTAERKTRAKKAAEARWGKAQKQDAPAKDQGDPLVPATKKKLPAARTKPAAESLKVHGDKLDTKSKTNR